MNYELKTLKHTLEIIYLRDAIIDLQLEVFKLKNPNCKEIDVIVYHTELLKTELERRNGII